MFKEKIANTLFVTDLGERTVTCEYQGLHYHGGNRVGIFIGCINEYILCSINVQLDNKEVIEKLKQLRNEEKFFINKILVFQIYEKPPVSWWFFLTFSKTSYIPRILKILLRQKAKELQQKK